MDLTKLGLFDLISQRMGYLTQRQNVLAQNVANADTPRYQPRDLRPFEEHLAHAGRQRLPPAATHPAHFGLGDGAGGEARSERLRDVYEAAPSGNEVVLEQQLLRLNETAAQYDMATNLYQRHLSMIKAALGRGGGR